ncbi:hypothetical protein D3C80_1018890 [compost metagenome]
MGGQGVEQVGHHFQVDHRGLVDHQYIQRQRVAGMVTKMPGARAAAEQAVHGGDLGGDFFAHRLAHREVLHLLANGLGQACRRLAGGRCQADTQGLARLHRRCLEQCQQAHHGGGLAGTRAAGDDAEGAAGRQCTGELLPVDQGRLAGGEQLIETHRQVGRHRFCGNQAFAQGAVNAPFEPPITPQVQTLPGQHQRPLPGRNAVLSRQCHQRAVGHGLAPGLHIQVLEQLRRQQQRTGQGIAFGR